ncbi:phosphoesterase RecJ domain-containing protein [Pilibacter termitis]|uniref:Phosphoesterase RecJ domain-containing protein n=1 Tax=Pilibacter termitis TaxID=263852 RepID=A0A1T4QGQ0_9ENTE|nr:bifunctional oligoribonuclease/PAP phosphatase NrnA [Pilibacter termitis]SKA02872.1 phosphoesterase RecJ domain-containing protein [Pilibacter termitis]
MNIEEKIINAIKKYDTILIHRHMRPDPDAIGSQVGLAEILRKNFPEKKIYAVGKTVEGLSFLAQMDEVSDEVYKNALVIVTDTANTARISDERYKNGEMLIKIDHHPNDEPYGDLVYVDTGVSSCSELIMRFMTNQGLSLTDNAARLLYAGIVGDTGRFLYPATTAKTMLIASKLRSYRFDATRLMREMEQISFNVAKLSGFVFENLEVDTNGAGRVMITKEVLAKFGLSDYETSHIVSLPGQIENVESWGIFVEQPNGKFRVRLRSKEIAINEIAKRHNGGGHPLASGANAKDLAECEEIYREIQGILNN